MRVTFPSGQNLHEKQSHGKGGTTDVSWLALGSSGSKAWCRLQGDLNIWASGEDRTVAVVFTVSWPRVAGQVASIDMHF